MHSSIAQFDQSLAEARHVWTSANENGSKSSDHWWSIYKEIITASSVQHLMDSGLCPRIVPSIVLPRIASDETGSGLKALFGALAISIVREQREKRIDRYSSEDPMKEREMENVPHVNWRPCDYPNWLLFEIEQNLTIRRIQIEIAKRMINPPDMGTQHSVMQLNMGEGKTAVIVPILASFLADGNQACQVTVLKSLFATNAKSLRNYLGGMIGRRIYMFPCRRDWPVRQHVETIIRLYEECKINKGVIVTLPEYRLSFQLMMYNSVPKREFDVTRRFLVAHDWINTNVRNILDESDAILHPKYQLIYSVGKQLPPDGNDLRWLVIQSLLKRVPFHMKQLQDELGDEAIEFDREYLKKCNIFGGTQVNSRPDVFTSCRILDGHLVFPRLNEALTNDFLNGQLDIVFQEPITALKESLKVAFFEDPEKVDPKYLEALLAPFSERERNIVLILCGYLRLEVLKLTLMKRWRVSYGVEPNGERLMAIPFKAKDVAAKRTEFGHPDVAICFTHLSYYYSGLTDEQMFQVFEILSKTANPDDVYEKWIANVPNKIVHPSIRRYSIINLNDAHQRDHLLFPLLKFNMYAIDFWLSREVLPREAKTFTHKLTCTAWDLCSESLTHKVTGFSGTNDTKDILPLPIAQNDLKELESTNEEMRQKLLRPENQCYCALPANVTGKQILQKLVQDGIPVLLDAGALMLELNNKQVAVEWLKQAPDMYDVGVYFDEQDILQTIDRSGIMAEFECSSYRKNLGRCLVYLDDTHTRGTDLKFPLGTKACVTLCGDITRDKTVQACMRMRQLGKGHKIAFWASSEANARIQSATSGDSITNKDVVKFICENSEKFERDNVSHWAASAFNYTKKLIGHKLINDSVDDRSLERLYEHCLENDYATLMELYGDIRKASLTMIFLRKFETLSSDKIRSVRDFKFTILEGVIGRINVKAQHERKFLSTLDDEQEKELEKEVEVEIQVEKPKPPKIETAATPQFDNRLNQMIRTKANGSILKALKVDSVLTPVEQCLTHVQFYQKYINKCGWAKHLLATKDFTCVIESTATNCDKYLRPIWWIARVNNGSNGTFSLILLSSYECDRMISSFRESKNAVLYMFHPRIKHLHSNLIRESALRVCGWENAPRIRVEEEVQIGMLSGLMYFADDEEQAAYCSFLGLIPRPRTVELESAFTQGIINPNGFVERKNRQFSELIGSIVGKCGFDQNSTDLAVKLIEAHHQHLPAGCHVASVLLRGIKAQINSSNDNEN
ncbi:hypothetical protein HA402_013734 [Bradysia odoriphaga]|nr:hypothetical protein HA402_013734 [Bradysia odoriphaga]